MALQKREKGMLVVVVGLLSIAVIIFLVRSGGSSTLSADITKLEGAIKELEIKTSPGEDAAKKLAELRSRSLPEDTDVARDLYNDWLSELAIDKVAFENVTIKPLAIRSGQSYYSVLPFTLNADGSLGQLTRFLYEFYSVNYLHKVGNLVISPIEDSSRFSLTIQIQAMSLPGAVAKDALPEGPANRLQHDELDTYNDMIVRRRMEENRPGSEEPYRYGETSSGLFAYYQDAPRRRTNINRDPVVERPVQQPVVQQSRPNPFNRADWTFVNSIQEVNGQKEVWLHVRTEKDMTLHLREGDTFKVDQMSGRIGKIRMDELNVEIETDRGVQRIALGDSITGSAMNSPVRVRPISTNNQAQAIGNR